MSLPNCGAAPRYLENLRIGGGYGSAPDGGADLDQAGNAAFDGAVTIAGALAANGGVAYKGVLRADSVHGGVNRDWLVAVPLFGNEASVTSGVTGPTAITFSSRMAFAAWDFPQSTLESLKISFVLPPDYDGSALRVRLAWCSQAAKGGTSGNVRWRVYMTAHGDGTAFTQGSTFVDVLDAFQGQDKFHLVDLTTTPNNATAGAPCSFTIRRAGDDVTDTFNADAQLMKVLVSYA